MNDEDIIDKIEFLLMDLMDDKNFFYALPYESDFPESYANTMTGKPAIELLKLFKEIK